MPALRVAIAGAIGCVVAVGAWHAASYFFLFDDFALLRDAQAHTAVAIFQQPLFGFYRPLAFLAVKPVFSVAGWHHPAWFAAAGLFVHLLNAGLVFALAIRLRLVPDAAAVAGTLFLLSASAAETYFWVSGTFDRLAALGLLIVAHAGLAFCRTPSFRRAVAWLGLGVIASAAAMLSKETAVLAPVVFGAVALLHDGWRLRRRSVAFVVALSLVSAGYLTLRERYLPELGGAYGSFESLLGGADLSRNLLAYVYATVVPPHPFSHGTPLLVTVSAIWIVLSIAAIGHSVRWVLVCALATAAMLTPAIWHHVIPGQSAGGRFLYIPGIWLALLVAGSVRADTRRWVVIPGLIVLLSLQTVSVVHQARLWRDASRLARRAIEQILPHVDQSGPLYIPNLPFAFAEGPYILKDYAFAAYYGPRFRPVVRATPMIVYERNGTLWAAAPTAVESADGAPEKTIALDLPIQLDHPARVEFVQPHPNGAFKAPFVISGRISASDKSSACDVRAVHLWAHPPQGRPLFLGEAPVGEHFEGSRETGPPRSTCGWWLHVSRLSRGPYVIAAHPIDVRSGQFGAASSVAMSVR